MMRHPRYWFYDIRCRLKFVLAGDCGHACDWCHPWGWVSEEGCPVHDVERKDNIRLGEEGTIWVSTSTDDAGLWTGEIKSWPKP